MGLFSNFKRRPGATQGAASAESAQTIEAARTRARRRLIGAVVLLGIGVIAFPLLFETQPRPIPVDIPIEIPRKESAAPLALPAARPPQAASKPVAVITESKAEAGKDATAAVEAPVGPAAKAVAAPASAAAPVAKAAPPKAVVPPAPVAVEPKPVAEAGGRFVVQIGAFADAALARDTRAKVEKMGLRTYTQAVETDNGKRIRVRLGPFASREEADKAAEKVKAAGLPAAVLTL